MALKTTRGVVISEKDLNETDKVITIFSEDGKINAVVNGVKNPKSPLAAGSRLFAWTEFSYYTGKNLARISQAHLIDSFYNISEQLENITLVSYISDLVNQFYDSYQVDKLLLKHLVYTFYYINKNPNKSLLITLAFQIKLLSILGIIPNINDLNNLDLEKPIYFSLTESKFTDKNFKNQYNYRITPIQIEILKNLYKLPLNKIKDLEQKNSEEYLKLIEIYNKFIEKQLGYSLKSFQILKELL